MGFVLPSRPRPAGSGAVASVVFAKATSIEELGRAVSLAGQPDRSEPSLAEHLDEVKRTDTPLGLRSLQEANQRGGGASHQAGTRARLRGRGNPYSPSRATSVRREMP